MAAEKACAIVLRTIEFSETSLVVTLFSREFGKLRALAKGGRRLKGPFESALDLLTVCRIVFLRKSSDALHLLTEAKLQWRFRARRDTLAGLYGGYYVAELLAELTEDHDPHPALFDLAEETLRALSAGEPVGRSLFRFELVALGLVGHSPSLSNCAECGQTVPAAGRIAFGHCSGGVLCSGCRPGKREVVSVRAGTLRTMSQLANSESRGWRHLVIDPDTQGELRAVLNRYLCNLLGRRPRMHRYL